MNFFFSGYFPIFFFEMHVEQVPMIQFFVSSSTQNAFPGWVNHITEFEKKWKINNA